MDNQDEFDGIEFDLRDLLDELVNQSLNAIGGMQLSDAMLSRKDKTEDERRYALICKAEFHAALAEVRFCYLSTIGFHD